MFHPLIKLLATRPQLLIQHVSGYAELALLQAGSTLRQLRQRALLSAGALAALLMGIGLAGVALLLLAVVPLVQMPAPWLLAAAPGAPLLLALLLWQMGQRLPAVTPLDALQTQWAADLQLLAEVQADGRAE